ncbi:MAG: hypothetical protein JW976_04065 [Syntrophaceae bacterium]|nr:hypothetical protein [Syntrophaceae bacterium]
MLNNKDINSTEKLLNVIRGKEESLGVFGQKKFSLTANKQIKNIKLNLYQRFFNKKKFTVGIDIGRNFICLAKTDKNSDYSYTLVDKKIIRYDPELSVNSFEFNNLLKSSIIEFCGNVADCDIWTKISTSEVNVYFFNVPKVPKKQLGRMIFWTAKKEGFIDEEKQIYDFEIQEEVVEKGTSKYSIMFYTANKVEIERIKLFADNIGIKLAGITIVPFAMQNIFRSKWIPSREETFATLFIGDTYSRIDVYNKENLLMTRGIKTGSSSSMAEAIVNCLRAKTGGLRVDQSEAEKILDSICSESNQLKDADALRGFKKEEILEMIIPVWERLARQVDLTLKTSSIGSKKVEKIYILSSVNFDKSILDYMSNQLGTKTEIFDPFKQRKSEILDKSLSSLDRILISPALGFSLSDNNRTPNAIFTYLEKNQEISMKQANKFAFVSFLVVLIICLVTLLYQGSKLNYLKGNKVDLEKELAPYSPLLSEELMLQTVDKVKKQRATAHQYAQRYWGLTAIGEVSALTPQNVRLINFRVREESISTQKDISKMPKENTYDVLIEGIIFDKKDMLESDMNQYIIKLENSPIFSNVSVQNKSVVNFDKKDVIHFVLNAKLG